MCGLEFLNRISILRLFGQTQMMPFCILTSGLQRFPLSHTLENLSVACMLLQMH